MQNSMITDNIFYVGANDRTTEKFEALWPLPYGVSYNSYLVKGTSKTALIDGVEVSHAFKQLSKIKAICPDRKIDYLIINHMEPDHSGGIFSLKKEFPDMQIVGNAKTLEMLNGFYGISDNTIAIADGDEIDLGGKTLKFFLTPMLHWPETMMTYAIEDKVLFSGDAFGCFGALNGGIVDKEMDTALYFPEMIRYYSNIVGKYGMPVQKAIAKLQGVAIDYICSTHGPVWHKQAGEVVALYDRLSKGIGEEGVVIAYGSMYGNTEDIIEILARELALCGIKNIRIHDVSHSDKSYILRDIYRYNGLIVAAPTYNGSLFPEMESLLKALVNRGVTNKIFARASSYTWAGVGTKTIDALLEKQKFTIVGAPIEMKQHNIDTIAGDCRSIAKEFADALKSLG